MKMTTIKLIKFSLLAPHTSGPRDVPRCGALSLLRRRATGGIQQKPLYSRLNVKLRDLRDCVTGGILLLFITQSFFESI